ncbi:Membrane protein-like protein [Lysobacter dokdonensis DS-58]|uniref:Membrane protein-like protein n=1 Tax=Lysobacter dokdonensis DS-58 TaxID=1300345 RepID=A0A0A2X3I2_9GAMM|nr:bestrophin family ion channel [Lysobacter dokdonensis]KGQ19789.1 Membrane protein-like protein [Lysobacter dokdonensis DS-58]
MLIERSYTVPEFLMWTRRSIYVLIVLGTVPVLLYEVAGLHFLQLPFAIIFLLGTTVALSAGFKNLQTYGRMQEAQVLWASIGSASRTWGASCRDLVPDAFAAKALIHRHLAWLAALRHELRKHKPWEQSDKPYFQEWKKFYTVPEHAQSLTFELSRYLVADEAAQVLEARNPPWQVLALQGAEAKRLLEAGAIPASAFAELQRATREFGELQGKVERIKNYPYPRQFAFIHSLFVKILCVLLPFGMISELERLNAVVGDWAAGYMVWLAIPLSVVVSWMYVSLDQVGESTENPFEGGANDVPITRICEEVERDLREMLGEIGLPAPSQLERGIAM